MKSNIRTKSLGPSLDRGVVFRFVLFCSFVLFLVPNHYAQANQKKHIIKVTVDDRYIAENYYSNQMGELLYEKDG